MASQFEMIASLISQDRFFMEVDDYGFGDLLKQILRLCHDLNNEKYDATWLAETIASLITGYIAGGNIQYWPEDEGSGPADWDVLDATKPDTKEAE